MKKVFRISPIIITAIILFIGAGCKKEEPESYTQSATNLSKTGATLNGTVNPNGLSTTVTFEYGTTTNYDGTVTAVQSPVNGNSIANVSADITGLTIGTIYHYRVKAENSHWTVYSSDNEFEYGYPPSVTTLAETNSKSTGVTLNGTVNPWGNSTTVTFEYGSTTSYDSTVTASQSPVTGYSFADVSADISGLKQCATYHFRVKAENGFGISYGPDTTFFTSGLPALITISISGITATEAISGGNFTFLGCTAVTDKGVDWWKISSLPCYRCPPPIHYYSHDGTGTGSFTSTLTGLLPSTNYRARAYATTSEGKVYGKMISFKTSGSGK